MKSFDKLLNQSQPNYRNMEQSVLWLVPESLFFSEYLTWAAGVVTQDFEQSIKLQSEVENYCIPFRKTKIMYLSKHLFVFNLTLCEAY